MTDPLTPAGRTPDAALGEPTLRGAVIHLNNEQPVVADLFEFPTARDVAVVCTNMRTQDGKRPVFIDQSDSIFVIPLAYVRFIELPRGMGPDGGEMIYQGALKGLLSSKRSPTAPFLHSMMRGKRVAKAN